MGLEQFFDAIWNHDLSQATEILRGNPSLVDQRDGYGPSALSLAAQFGELPIVQLLIENGADVNARDQSGDSAIGNSPLHWAAIGSFPSVVAFLLEKGAEVNSDGENSWTPIESLVGSFLAGDVQATNQIMELLLTNGAKVKTVAVSAAIGDIEKTKQLVNDGADPDESVGTQERTALHIAVANGNRDMVEYLVTVTKNINCSDLNGHTPLELASDDQIQASLRQHGGRTSDEIEDEIYDAFQQKNAVERLAQVIERASKSTGSNPQPNASKEGPSSFQDEEAR